MRGVMLAGNNEHDAVNNDAVWREIPPEMRLCRSIGNGDVQSAAAAARIVENASGSTETGLRYSSEREGERGGERRSTR